MTWFDWALIGLVTLSLLVGVLRGLVREVLSLAGWVAAVVLAVRFAVELGAQLPFEALVPVAKTALAGLLILVGALALTAIAGWLMGKLLAAVKLSTLDRVLGALFGALRALLVVFVLVWLAERTAIAKQAFWRDSVLLPYAQAAVRSLARLLPAPLTFVAAQLSHPGA